MVFLRYLLLIIPILTVSHLLGQRQIVLPAHTPLQLTTIEETRATEVQPGDMVNLRVLLDVKVDGEIIIRNGAFAQAQVRLRYVDGNRKKPELILLPRTVQAANGVLIPLYGDGLLFGGRGRRARLALPTGKTMAAAVHYKTKLSFE